MQELEQRSSELSVLRAELASLQTEHQAKVAALVAQIASLEQDVMRAQQQGQGDAASAARQVTLVLVAAGHGQRGNRGQKGYAYLKWGGPALRFGALLMGRGWKRGPGQTHCSGQPGSFSGLGSPLIFLDSPLVFWMRPRALLVCAGPRA